MVKRVGDIVSKRLGGIKNNPVYAKYEWQDFGVRVAKELGDEKRTPMYIRLAKENGMEIMQEALDFVKESKSVKSKPKLFLWKFKQIKEEALGDEREKS